MTTQSATLYQKPPQNLADHVRRTLSLAVPVMLARAGLVVMVTVDSIMVGHASAEQLAHYAIAFALHVFLLVAGLGLLIGTVVLTARADGAERYGDAGPIWHSALLVAAAVGTLGGGIMLAGEPILLLFGQEPDIAAGGHGVLVQFSWSMPAILMFIATSFFLEGINRPRAGMVIALLANLPNAALNWVLIYGNLGLPAMGADGAALATTITRWIMLFALVGYALNMNGATAYGVRRWIGGTVGRLGALLRIGVPLSLAVSSESAAFALIATFAGRLGETPLAAYQICLNVVSFIFMLSIGLSTATSVRVSNAVGQSDRPRMAVAGWTGVGLCLIVMFAAAVLIFAFSGPIAAIYTDEARVLHVAIPALAVVAVAVIFDGGQAVLMGALRGTSDVVVPTAMQAVAFWVVAVPIAYVFGLELDRGVPGLLNGLLAGLCAAALFLFLRFLVISRRPLTDHRAADS
ncbi:MAG: MATE family efflux transporter [Rhodovibrionaceae bacterium]|nr:MATE family efflux transporter [Rhodovibrionaceae bacterium]